MISLATKAGKTASGEFSTEKEVKTGYAELVIVATDASENTKKKFMIDYHIYLMHQYYLFQQKRVKEWTSYLE